jgi:hypothetical protein
MRSAWNVLAWLLLVGAVAGTCYFASDPGGLQLADADGFARCPADCHYASHRGSPLDPAFPSMEVTSPAFCPKHSLQFAQASRRPR